MTKPFILLLSFSISFNCLGQNGYIRTLDKDRLVGFVKHVTSPVTGDKMLEYWETQNDKSPERFPLNEIQEYAIGKDTILVLQNFKPFDSEDVIFDLVEAEIITSGRVHLLKFQNPYYTKNQIAIATGGIIMTVAVNIFTEPIERIPYIYALREPRDNYLRGVPEMPQLFFEIINDFYSQKAVQDFETEHGRLVYRKLIKFARFCNGEL